MLKLLLLLALTAALTGCSPRSTPSSDPKSTPAKLPPGATFDIYTIAAANWPNTTQAIDPDTGGPLFLQTPPFLTKADISTVARSEIEVETVNGTPSGHIQPVLHVELTPAGAAKMATATATLTGQPIAVVFNGQVLATPKVHSQIQGSFKISCDAQSTSVIEAITKP